MQITPENRLDTLDICPAYYLCSHDQEVRSTPGHIGSFTINGKVMRGIAHNDPSYQTCFSMNLAPKHRREQVEILIGRRPADLSDNRTGLYYCPMCFDISDGLVSTELVFTDSYVIWKDFAWEDADHKELDSRSQSYRFDRKEYTTLLLNRINESESAELRRILNDIDFLGIYPDEAEVEDEYDCMLSDLKKLLSQGATVKEIQAYLRQELRDHFGLEDDWPKFYHYHSWANTIIKWWSTSGRKD